MSLQLKGKNKTVIILWKILTELKILARETQFYNSLIKAFHHRKLSKDHIRHSSLKTLVYSTLLATFCLLSCQSRGSESTEAPPLTHTLKKVGQYELELDSVTAPDFTHYQHFKDGEEEYLTFLNKLTQEINFYNLKSKQLAFKVLLNYEGPNSVGDLKGFNSGYYVHSLDSVFVLNRNLGRVFLVNSNSEVLTHYQTAFDKVIPSPVIAPSAPMYLHNNKAHLLNIQTGINHFGVNKNYDSDYASIINLQNLETQTYLTYPEPYTEGIWGIGLHQISWTLNPLSQKFLVSYPIDDYLYEYDLNGQPTGKHLAKGRLKTEPTSMEKRHFSAQGRKRYILSQSKYGLIKFDPYHEILIRACTGAVPETALTSTGFKPADRSIMLFNKDYQQIAEMTESSKKPLILFFNEQGIHKYLETENEDKLTFEIYEVVAQ